MGDAAIKWRPNISASKVGPPKRDNMKFTATWAVPSPATYKSSSCRWTWSYCEWRIWYTNKNDTQRKKVKEWKKAYWLKWFDDIGTTTHSYTLKRSDWYPNTNDVLTHVETCQGGWNNKGYGPWKRYSFVMHPPAMPTITQAFDNDGDFIFTIKNSKLESSSAYDRSNTDWKLWRRDSKGVRADKRYEKWKVLDSGQYNSYGSANLEKKIYWDQGVHETLVPGQWIELWLDAYNLGVGGYSDTRTSRHIFAYPAQAQITGIRLSDPLHPYTNTTQTLSISCKTNSTEYAPVDEIKLEKLVNTDAATASAANLKTGWTAVEGAVDDNMCHGFSDVAAGNIPEVGKHTWYRLVTKHDELTRISTPVEVEPWFREEGTAVDDAIKIITCNGNKDGTSIDVVLGWNTDDLTGTEISWSEYSDAWRSSKQPTTYKFTWKDGTPKVSGYENTAKFTIRDLTEGNEYYIKARRYREMSSGSETYGKYNIPLRNADWPTLVIDESSGKYEIPSVDVYLQQPFIRGRDASISWTYDCELPQVHYQVLRYILNSNGAIVSTSAIANGSGGITSALIPKRAFSTSVTSGNKSVAFAVKVTCGEGWNEKKKTAIGLNCTALSSRVTATIHDAPPAVSIGALTLTQQPLKLQVTTDSAKRDFIVTIRSRGGSVQRPYGNQVQAENDVIYSARLSPSWTTRSGKSVGTMTFPSNLDFLDGMKYTLECTAVDTNNELRSATKRSLITVAWKHQAKPPSKSSKVVANPNSKYATIIPVAPSGAASTDVCDIYRMTPDGAQRIAESVTFGSEVTDRWAPYSKITPLYYRIATRTVDGDTEFLDIPYNLNGYAIRFDWDGGKVLEVPFNLKYSDGYSKDFEERSHLNGDHAGYWNEGHSRKTSVSTEMVRLSDPDQVTLARELAQYSGAVYVRFPNACSFMANVDVNTIGTDYSSLVLDVSFDITEVLLTPEFTVDKTDIKRP